MKKIESFNNLKSGNLIISPIDNEVTEFYVNSEGEQYLKGKKLSLFPIFQFNPEDFYFYIGNMKNGEVDKNYFK